MMSATQLVFSYLNAILNIVLSLFVLRKLAREIARYCPEKNPFTSILAPFSRLPSSIGNFKGAVLGRANPEI